MCQQPKHTVYRLKPMESTPPILFPPNRRPQQPAKDLFDSLPFIFKGSIPSSTSKCVQLPANERYRIRTHFVRVQVHCNTTCALSGKLIFIAAICDLS